MKPSEIISLVLGIIGSITGLIGFFLSIFNFKQAQQDRKTDLRVAFYNMIAMPDMTELATVSIVNHGRSPVEVSEIFLSYGGEADILPMPEAFLQYELPRELQPGKRVSIHLRLVPILGESTEIGNPFEANIIAKIRTSLGETFESKPIDLKSYKERIESKPANRK